MNESIAEMSRLLEEIVGHLKVGTSPEKQKAVNKLQRIAAVTSTMVLTLKVQR